MLYETDVGTFFVHCMHAAVLLMSKLTRNVSTVVCYNTVALPIEAHNILVTTVCMYQLKYPNETKTISSLFSKISVRIKGIGSSL